MWSIRYRFLLTCTAMGAALLLMGANGAGPTSVVSSATHSVTTAPTTSVVSKPTGSVKIRMVGSIASGSISSATSTVVGSAVALSPAAEELARTIKFDRQVLLLVKEATREHIRRLAGYDAEGYQINAPGIAVPVPRERTEQVLAELRRKLLPLQYLPFIVERNQGSKIERIGVIKGTDPYEIIRIMHTDGVENEITNQDIIDRLQEWDLTFPFTIIGADSDWVELELKAVPYDLETFVEDVYLFSPGAVDQGQETVEKLMTQIRKTRRLRLYWE